jgi:hypothetical protein
LESDHWAWHRRCAPLGNSHAIITFKYHPGTVFTGRVQAVLQAVATGQVQASGQAVAPKGVEATPFVVRIALDEQAVANGLPAGSTGTAAIFTDRVAAAHVFRKVCCCGRPRS